MNMSRSGSPTPTLPHPDAASIMAESIDEKAASVHAYKERSMLKNLVLIGTVTLAQILNVSASVFGGIPTTFPRLIAACT